MKIVEIIRLEESADGNIGVLKIDKIVFCWTLELPYRMNKQNISCIPTKQYSCRRTISSKFGNTFQVLDVPDRSNILFHPGNTEKNSKGCILLGKSIGSLIGKRAVLDSHITFEKFMLSMKNTNDFNLTIKNYY